MTALDVADPAELVGVLTCAPDGTTIPAPILVDRGGSGSVEFTCSSCGRQVNFVNGTAQRIQWFATSHRCGGAAWQG